MTDKIQPRNILSLDYSPIISFNFDFLSDEHHQRRDG